MANRNLRFPDAVGEIERCLGANLRTEHAGKNGKSYFDWDSLAKLNAGYQDRVVKWRGFTPDFSERIIRNDWLRIFTKNGVKHWAFPVVVNGQILGCHHRPPTELARAQRAAMGADLEPARHINGRLPGIGNPTTQARERALQTSRELAERRSRDAYDREIEWELGQPERDRLRTEAKAKSRTIGRMACNALRERTRWAD
jgi:hypothetical protein